MKFCKNCGQQINEGSRFCRNCGANLPPPVEQPETLQEDRSMASPTLPAMNKCAVCQIVNRMDATFCKSCGNKLSFRVSTVETTSSVQSHQVKNINTPYSHQPAERKPPEPVPGNTFTPKPVAAASPVINIPAPASAHKVYRETKPFPVTILIAGIALLLIVCSCIGYFVFYKPYINERDLPRFYTFAPSVFLRSTPEAGVDYNSLGSIPYGSELVVYENGYEWSKVKWKNNQTNKEVIGYISSNYILYADDFRLLNSIWGDNISKERIATAKCRMALLNYFKDNDLNNWKVYSRHKDAGYTEIAFPNRLVSTNSTFTDFAVIIKNDNSTDRRFLLFYFDQDETPHLAYEEPAPPQGYIKSITRSTNGFTVVYTQ